MFEADWSFKGLPFSFNFFLFLKFLNVLLSLFSKPF